MHNLLSLLQEFGTEFGTEVKNTYFSKNKVVTNETKDSFIINMEVAGFSKEDIKIKTVGDQLHITGENEFGTELNKAYELNTEFGREFKIKELKAVCKNGMLTLTFPRKKKAVNEIEID